MNRSSRRHFFRDSAALAGAGLLAPFGLGGAHGRLSAATVIPRRKFGRTAWR